MNVVVAGGGIVGLTCAWWLVEAGHQVTVFDPAPGRGASYAAAGMIAPAGEAWFGEEDLLRLGLASAALWPDLAGRLGVRYARTGSLLVAKDSGDLATLRRSTGLVARLGLPVLDPAPPGLEPTLTDRVCGTALLPDDAYVDPREVMDALISALDDRVIRSPAPESASSGSVLVRCTGTAVHPRVRPVRGEIVRVRCEDPPTRIIRGLVHGEPVYLVPRADGQVVIGATSEEHDGPPVVTVGGVLRLLEAARTLVPGLDRAEVVEALVRDRPGTPDNGPLIGWTDPNTIIAGGHYRGGVLLAPITAAAVLTLVEDAPLPAEVHPFHPSRFDQEVAQP